MKTPTLKLSLTYPSYGVNHPRAHVRVYENQTRYIAIVSELPPALPAPSLTNSIEDLARSLLEYQVDPSRFDLIQYSPQPESFELVTVPEGWAAFAKSSRAVIGQATQPTWSPLTRADVERLIGGSFE